MQITPRQVLSSMPQLSVLERILWDRNPPIGSKISDWFRSSCGLSTIRAKKKMVQVRFFRKLNLFTQVVPRGVGTHTGNVIQLVLAESLKPEPTSFCLQLSAPRVGPVKSSKPDRVGQARISQKTQKTSYLKFSGFSASGLQRTRQSTRRPRAVP